MTLLALPVNPENGDIDGVVGNVIIDADGNALFAGLFDLVNICRLGNLSLEKSALQGSNHASHVFDAPEVVIRAGLHLVGQRFQEVAAPQGINRIGDPGLVGDDLLRA